jgi:N-acetylglucosamine-6-phosphate deacetylase
MIRVSGADLVLPDRVLSRGTIAVEGDRITAIDADADVPGTELHLVFPDHYVVPGFIDVHVHGVGGRDSLDGGDAIREIAAALPAFGVTAFCPTTVACTPADLRNVLESVRAARITRPSAGARVLPAHLESNFISPAFKGAQPAECLRLPTRRKGPAADGTWAADEILAEIAAARPDVGILTVAPELQGALDLIEELAGNGHHVSLGHSGATYEEAVAGIRAGARQATHLFNRMTPIAHRAPGLAAAILESDDVTAELVCDGVHVHPSMVRVALAAKGRDRIMAITDGTAGSGLPRGSHARLGGRRITVGDAAYLDDGTIAGSVLTMDVAFSRLVTGMGLSLVDASAVCSSTPARALGLQHFGVLAPGAVADFVVLDRDLRVVQTWIAGTLAFSNDSDVTGGTRLPPAPSKPV